jgi:hypothetical protein
MLNPAVVPGSRVSNERKKEKGKRKKGKGREELCGH